MHHVVFVHDLDRGLHQFVRLYQWVACMDQAMGELQVEAALRARLRNSFFQTADWMRNR